MKAKTLLLLVLGSSHLLCSQLSAQAIEVTSTGKVGIGTSLPNFKLDVSGDIRATGALIEKKVVFTPTAVGWYRIVSGLGGAGLGQAGGTIRTMGNYDGGTTSVEFVFNVRGWAQGGSLTLMKNTGVNGNLIDQARISTDGGGTMYLDLHVSTATSPAPITILGYGLDMPEFVANPVVGATAGSASVQVLPVGWTGVGGYDGFRTSGSIATYGPDGGPRGYIYHGPTWQVGFGNGITNGETWITRMGGGGTIKFGEYDFSSALMTIASSGNVGIGTTAPGYKLEVAGSVRATSFIGNVNTYADFVFKPEYKLRSLSEVDTYIAAHGHLPDIPTEVEVKARGIDLAEMQVKLLQKVEELTLYLVAHDKEIKLLRAENAALRQQFSDASR